MNIEAIKDLNLKQLQYYYRIQEDKEFQPLRAIQDNKVTQLIHSLVMEIEKPNSYYNKFKENLTFHVYLWNEEKHTMDLIKSIPFTKLFQTEQKGA